MLFQCMPRKARPMQVEDRQQSPMPSLSLSSGTVFVITLSNGRSSAGRGTSAAWAQLCCSALLGRCHRDQTEGKRRCISFQSRSQALEAPEMYSGETSCKNKSENVHMLAEQESLNTNIPLIPNASSVLPKLSCHCSFFPP